MIKLIQPEWPAPENVKSLVTTRQGGVSKAPWDALNLATHVEDDRSNVKINRAILAKAAQLPSEPQWLNQTHSVKAVNLQAEHDRNSDAAYTQQVGQVAVVLTADCLPILLCNRQGSEVAAIHAGWRGLADGIVMQTIQAMSSRVIDLLAYIGPSITQPYFEVGEEVKQLFCDRFTGADQHFQSNHNGRYQANNIGLAIDQLQSMGVKAVYGGDLCSYAQADLFYSYRRDGLTGRMASLIWMEPNKQKM